MYNLYNYNIKENKNNNFFDILNENKESYFAIDVPDTDYVKYLELDLQEPNFLRRFQNSYKIIYLIDGYFRTNKSKEFFNDIKERLIFTLGGEEWKIKLWSWKFYEKKDYYFPAIEFEDIEILHYGKYELCDFEGLERPRTIKKRMFEVNQTRDKIFSLLGDDNLFEAARWLIYQSKIDGTLSEDKSFEILSSQNDKFGLNKSFSDIRSKAKNMTEWTEENYNLGKHSPDYYNNYYKDIRSKKDDRMTQKMSLSLEAKRKKNLTESKILDGIKILMDIEEKFNKSNLAKITGLSRPTLNKYENLYKEFI